MAILGKRKGGPVDVRTIGATWCGKEWGMADEMIHTRQRRR